MNKQFNIFDYLQEDVKITKPIRLIEFFAGYGSQNLALKYLGANYESWKICEWATKSIQAYKDLHHSQDNNDYSKELTFDEIKEKLFSLGISADYNKPMTYDQIKRKGESWCRNVYNNIIATNNLVNIQQVKGKDLNIIDTDKYDYVLTYSFPCQDLSLAGKGAGMEKGSGTRSGMLWEVERILKECEKLPHILLMENVTQIHSKKNKDNFNLWIKALNELGYASFWKDMNSKNYGVPQNRDRTFMISVLKSYNSGKYEFPQGFKLELTLADMLEDEVDEKYYLSEKMIKYISEKGTGGFANADCRINLEVLRDTPKVVGGIGEKKSNGGTQYYQQDRIYDGSGIAMCHPANLPSGSYMYAFVEEKNFINILLAIFDLCGKINIEESEKYERSRTLLSILWEEITKEKVWKEIGRFQRFQEKEILQSRMYEQILFENRNNESKISSSSCNSSEYNEITEKKSSLFNLWQNFKVRYTPYRWELQQQQFEQLNIFMQELSYEKTSSERYLRDLRFSNERFRVLQQTLYKLQEIWQPFRQKLRIRKLTPREAGRLMGVRDSDIDKMSKNQSNSSLYHLFGDSIVVDVLTNIFKNLLV